MTKTSAVTPAKAMPAADEASRRLGIELLEHGEGAADLRMTVNSGNGERTQDRPRRLCAPGRQPAFAWACRSYGLVTVGAGASIAFVAPANEGDVLVASAEERTRFSLSGIYDVSVRRGAWVIAEFRGRRRTVRTMNNDTAATRAPSRTTKES